MRIFIADESEDLRIGLQVFLYQEPGYEVIGLADNGRGLLTQVEASQPEVLLLDWYLPGAPITNLIADMRALNPRLKIIILSVRPEDEKACMTAGADYFIVKNSYPQKLKDILLDTKQIITDG